MNAGLITCSRGRAEHECAVIPDNYDGDPYGDTVPFSIGSNQAIVPCEGDCWKCEAKGNLHPHHPDFKLENVKEG